MPVDETHRRKRQTTHDERTDDPAEVGEALFAGEFGTRDTLAYVEEVGQLGLWAWDLETGAMVWSHGLHTLLDVLPGEVAPSHDLVGALTHPDDRLPRGEVERMLRDGVSVSREFRLVRPNGRVRWIRQRGETLLDASGRRSRAIGVMMDVTAAADARYTAKIAEERLSALTRASGAAVWTSDPDGGSGLLDGLGPSPAEAEARPVMTIHPEDTAECRRHWSRARIETAPLSTECRVRAGGGTERWVRLGAAPILDGAGQVREWIWASFALDDRTRSPLLQGSAFDGTEPPPLTGAQLRAARGCLNWSVRDLSEASGVSPSVIRRLEETDDAPTGRLASMNDLRQSLERAGIEFLFPSAGKPGVRPR